MSEVVIAESMVAGGNPDDIERTPDLVVDRTDCSADKHKSVTELSLEEAAAVLGKSVKAMERSLAGRWGNRLPDGWSARKVKTGSGVEWRLCPPANLQWNSIHDKQAAAADGAGWMPLAGNRALIKYQESDFNQSIVIERGHEIEGLLKELLVAHKSLAEERKLHLDDLQKLSELQSRLLLIEADVAQKEKIKVQLVAAEAELARIKSEYEVFLQSPWWKRLLRIR